MLCCLHGARSCAILARAMLLNAHGAARLLATSERQIYRWVDDGEIPCRRVRDQLRFNPTDLLEWATTRRMPVHVDAFEDDDPRDRPPSLAAALAVGGVRRGVPGANRDEIVRALIERLQLPGTFDRELLIEVLLARPSSGLTAVGDGIAIPHVRNPIVTPGGRAAVTIAYLVTPIILDAPDGQPTRTLIVATTPTVRTHLRLIARVSRAIADPAFKAALARHTELAELVREAERVEALPPPELPE